jgi:hypothetical protein
MRPRIIALALAAMLLLPLPAGASGGCGEVGVSPNPGWRGANITISGTGFTPGTQIFVNFGGSPIGSTTSNSQGAFSMPYTIPSDFPVGTTNIFANDGGTCEDNPSYTVNAGPPTTTTTTTTTATTIEATTTTLTEEDSAYEDGGSSTLLMVVVGALLSAGLLGGGLLLGRRMAGPSKSAE